MFKTKTGAISIFTLFILTGSIGILALILSGQDKEVAQALLRENDARVTAGIQISQTPHAGRNLFPPSIYLVQAQVISTHRKPSIRYPDSHYTEHADLRITHVYVGPSQLKHRIFEALQFKNSNSGNKFPNENNPMFIVGEHGIWWVTKRDAGSMEADWNCDDLHCVGGWDPFREGVSNRTRVSYPSYNEGIQYALYWEKLYKQADARCLISLLRQGVLSRNAYISYGSFALLTSHAPQGSEQCLRELAADLNTPAEKLDDIKWHLHVWEQRKQESVKEFD